MKVMALFAALLVTLPFSRAAPQKQRDPSEYKKKLEQFVKESELAGAIHEEIEARQKKLEELHVKMAELEIEQLREMFETLAEKYPGAEEKLDKLESIAEESIRLRHKAEDLHRQGKEILESMDLKPEQAKELVTKLGRGASGTFKQTQRYVAWKKENERLKERSDKKNQEESERLEKIEKMLREQEERFAEMKDQNPKMFELVTRQREILEQINASRQELVDMFRRHLRSEKQ